MMHSLAPRILAAVLCGFFLCLAGAKAQNMTQVFESVLGRSTAGAEQTEPTASEQLNWVAEQLQAARNRSETIASPAFQEKVLSGGFPAQRTAQLQREAAEAREVWTLAQNVLQWIVAWEAMPPSETEPPPIPQETAEAFSLERKLEDLQSELARIQFEASAQTSVIARAEQQQRIARRNLSELKVEAAENLPPASRDRSDVEIMQSTIRLDDANAIIFYQRWQKYRQQLEAAQIQAQAEQIRGVLEQSNFRRMLSANRATAEIERIQNELPEIKADEASAAEAFEKISGELTELRRRMKEATADGSAAPPELQTELQNALREFTRQETMRGITQGRATLLQHSADIWSRVLSLVEDPTLADLREARSTLQDEQPATENMARRIDRLLEDSRDAGDKFRQDLRMPALSANEKSALEQQVEKNQNLTEKLVVVQQDIAALRSLQSRLIAELEAEIALLSAQRRWTVMIESILQQVKNVWDFSITEQGDRVVTLGSIITAMVALVLALVLARLVAMRVSSMAGKRFKLGQSQAHLVEKITLYLLSIIFVLMVLQWLRIPLTVFAFLGGALAVGIGFGSQNLINNFISGLLLLLERKINVGDLVEVDGNFGRVMNLGSRCSAIRKFDGVEVLVPNSALLEKNVVNWTLSDPMHRYDFGVGVAYGSDVEVVMRTLQEALDAQSELIRDPAPEVAFEDFADSTLNFHVYYWLVVGLHSPRHVGTELRVRIARLFQERNLQMAFPQRDVHLLADKPIEVRLHENP
jgi:potassium efflux system protein